MSSVTSDIPALPKPLLDDLLAAVENCSDVADSMPVGGSVVARANSLLALVRAFGFKTEASHTVDQV